MILSILIGPADFFAHGFFADVPQYANIDERDFEGYVDLSEGKFETQFIPQKEHFAGFELVITNLLDDRTGNIQVSILNHNEKIVDRN